MFAYAGRFYTGTTLTGKLQGRSIRPIRFIEECDWLVHIALSIFYCTGPTSLSWFHFSSVCDWTYFMCRVIHWPFFWEFELCVVLYGE